MDNHSSSGGFTIIEVLIFLGITGVILISALVGIGGRQSQIQFEQGVRDIDSHIRAVINDVANGYFPSQSFNCTNSPLQPDWLEIYPTPFEQGQGTKEDCLYLGKAIRLTNDPPPGEENMGLEVISIAAARADIGEAATINDSKLTPINNGEVDITEQKPTPWRMKIYGITDSSGNEVSYIAFLSGLGESTDGGMESGIQPINVYAGRAGAQEIHNGSMDDLPLPLPPDRDIYLCLESADEKRYGVIIIGKDGRNLSTTIDQDATRGEYPQCDDFL